MSGQVNRAKLNKVLVEAPATSANLGPGFDVFAIALSAPRDRLEIELSPSQKFEVRLKVEKAPGIPADPHTNAAGAVILSMARKFHLKGRIVGRLVKGVPVGVGLGSSGASSAAAALAMKQLFSLRASVSELVAYAGVGEEAASGAAHLDNVTASLLGGFVIVRGRNAAAIHFATPSSLAIVLVTPKVHLPARKTEYARSLVPKTVPTTKMTNNVAMAATMVAGLARSDIRMIGEGMEDAVIEVARAKMVPGFNAVRNAAKVAGAAGVCLSGAGPSMLSIVDRDKSKPRDVLESMVDAFRSHKVEARGFVTSVGGGAWVVESS
jgi:homoserine kinase